MTPTRKIIHIDMDAFFASVEMLDHPEWKGKPLIVGGTPEGRGVVAAASYEARKFGVRSAMSCSQAKRLCPQAIFTRPRISRYAEVSDQIFEILKLATDRIEPLSIDEAYLDVTQNKWDEPLAGKIALRLKHLIRERTGLTASAGVAPNKFLAKIASDLKKPDGLVVIPPSEIEKVLPHLPVEKLWGVGPVTAQKLHDLGIFKALDLRTFNFETLERHLGSFARFLVDLSHGVDHRGVESHSEPKSRGAETTFAEDQRDRAFLLSALDELCEEVALDLQAIQKRGRTLTIKIRFKNFETITRSKTLLFHTNAVERIQREARGLLYLELDQGQRPIRLLGVSVKSFLSEEEPEQLVLPFIFDNPSLY